MDKTILILIDKADNDRYYQRFGIRYLLEVGFRVEVWNMSPVIHPAMANKIDPDGAPEGVTLTTFDRRSELQRRLAELSPERYWLFLPFPAGKATRFIYDIITARQLDYIIKDIKSQPTAPEFAQYVQGQYNPPPAQKALQQMKYLSWRFNWRYQVRKPTFALVGTAYHQQLLAKRLGPATEVIKSHVEDYETCQRTQEGEAPDFGLPENEYGIFLDQCLPTLSDAVLREKKFGIKNPITAERYYPTLQRFFAHVEQITGRSVVFAAHPKTDPQVIQHYFPDRPCFIGKSAALARHCQFAITHFSTSLNFAVLFHKPIIFCRTAEMQGNPYEQQAAYLAQLLDRPLIDAEAPTNRSVQAVNETAYQQFIHKYIKEAGTPPESTWQTAAQRLAAAQETLAPA